jgi:TolB-like protein/DNA-binding winged helix-turn-helix (wHTH) protein
MLATPPAPTALPCRFRLGEWLVDSAVGELVGAHERVALNGLSLALLLAMVRRAGQLSDTDSLIAEVWEREAVSDATLQQRVKLLRRALRDDSDTPRYIATVRGRGYRLLVQPEWLADTAAQAPTPQPPRAETMNTITAPTARGKAGRWAALALTLVIAGAASLNWYLPSRSSAHGDARRLVVLPLSFQPAGTDNQLQADSLTEQLIWTMARIPELEVIGRNSSMSYKQHPRALQEMAPQLARELGVGSVLQGNIVRSGDSVQISLTLLDVHTLRALWSKRFNTGKDGFTNVNTEVAAQVAQALGVAHSGEPALPPDGDSYTLYLQGRQHYLRYTAKENSAATDLFRASLARSPAYAPALAGLSDAYAQAVYQFGAPNNQLDDALHYADAAVALAPQLAEAHKARGLALDLLGRRREAAASYHAASLLNPNYSDALINEAILHWESGRLAEAYRLAQRATALDPLDPYAYLITAQVLTSGGFAPTAQAILEQVQKHAPDDAMVQTVRCGHWLELGQNARAETECQALNKQHPDFAPGWTLSADLALIDGQTALALERYTMAAGLGAGTDAAYARLRLAAAQSPVQNANVMPLLAELRHRIEQHDEDPDHQLQLAMLLAALGRVDEGMTALEAAVQGGHNDRHWLETDPVLAPLRKHPRYRAVLAKLDERLGSEHKKLQTLLEARTPPR